MMMEKHVIEHIPFDGDLEKAIDDDLVYHVPIYDMGSRKYAAFCNLTQAVIHKQNDVKGNGLWFKDVEIEDEFDLIYMLYLFRLCGSGINYKPIVKSDNLFNQMPFLGKHGFGNFWIVKSLLEGKYDRESWIQDLKDLNGPFSDNKGYIIPQFSIGLKRFIVEYSEPFVRALYAVFAKQKLEIYQLTDLGNDILTKEYGFNRQNFVLTAFAADLAEYFPHYIEPYSKVYVGTNAQLCIKTFFKKSKVIKDFDFFNEVLDFQAHRYGLKPIDCEDSRNCDVIRYIREYQSAWHVRKNNGIVMKNNSSLKNKLGLESYYEYARNI
jgi:hypothetical protein